MFRLVILAICLSCTLQLQAQEGYTKKVAAEMLAVMAPAGERVVIDRQVTVNDEYSDFTFRAEASASGYHVALVFPYTAGFTKFDGYVTYGNEEKRLPFKFTASTKTGRLYLKVPCKPGATAHLRFRNDHHHFFEHQPGQ